MKVILTRDVEHVGQRGEIVRVSDGYARNFLLPRKLAIRGTPANLRQIESIRGQLAAREDKIRTRLTSIADKLAAVTVRTAIRMGDAGAFGSITNADIAGLLKAAGFDIDRHAIAPEEPIKAPGTYSIPIRLGHEVTATVKLDVAEEPA